MPYFKVYFKPSDQRNVEKLALCMFFISEVRLHDFKLQESSWQSLLYFLDSERMETDQHLWV